ncbi:gamma conglutin 1-like [Bidens hawaiensis]|uniref:gamma conglutin 1-like n=1 Tax=Bidens hawaiensis TaxID=980011 RepID=UPI004049B9E4
MYLPLKILVIILALIANQHEAIAAYVPPYTSIVVPVNKHTDAAKPLYSVQIMTAYVNMQFMHENFLIDIDAPFIWHDCIVQWNIYPGSCPSNTLCTSPVSCEEFQCTDVRTSYSYKNPSCHPETNSSTLPGWGFCTCPVNVVNPVTGSCSQALLNYDEFTVNTSDGRNTFDGFYGAYPNAACAPSSSFASLSANVSGVMAFSTSPYAFPRYLYEPLKRTLALCLPSKPSAPGRFAMVTKRLPPAKPVAPFGLCYNSSTTGLRVPDIDFSLPDGKKWTVSTTNSIKQVTNEVACLAFVDGGAMSEPAILIGTFQFEDNFLEFDLENSTLGFSSSLLRKQTSCANFNFTLIHGP